MTKIETWAVEVCQNIDQELMEERERSGTKYEPVFSRDCIKRNFGELVEQIVQDSQREGEPQEVLEEHVDTIKDLEKDVLCWFDGDSPLGKLEAYFEVFTIRKSAQRQLRSLATSYMRFTNWQPSFTQDEVIRFIRTRQTKSSSRKTYGSCLRTFFKAQGIPRDKLPFEYDRIKVADEDQPRRKTLPQDKVKHFIELVRQSDSARAGFYGSLVTTYGFRPIELGRITLENIDRERHVLSVQTAKHGRVRVHSIPEPIRPFVYGYEPQPVSDKQMNRVWQYVCRDSGFRPPKGYGWYGIRHALFTKLANYSGIPAQAIDKWGGWQTGVVSGAGMSNIYNAPDTVDLMAIDKTVLEKHPFLGYWDGK